MRKRARRFAGGFVSFLALTFAAKACADLTAPEGVVDVVIDYDEASVTFPRGGTPPGSAWDTLPNGDSLPTITVTVGTRFAPPFRVMIGQTVQQSARYTYTIGSP